MDLEYGDLVEFYIKGQVVSYRVREEYLENTTIGSMGYNGRIFQLLGIEDDRFSFCSMYYGYEVSRGEFPEYRCGDYKALNRVVEALNKECIRFNNEYKKVVKDEINYDGGF
jgi:hypothetical protein